MEDFSVADPKDNESFAQLVTHMYKSDFIKQPSQTPKPDSTPVSLLDRGSDPAFRSHFNSTAQH